MKNIIAQLMLQLMFSYATAQDNQNVQIVVNEITIHKKQVALNESLQMLELNRIVPHIQIELLYATTNNFTHVRMYARNTTRTFMRKDAANALVSVAKELEINGIGIKVWDAYRPFSVTQKFWDLIHDERYVANPSKGSGHNRGIAIDLTLYDLKSGKEIDMPTGFDNFSEAAHHGYMELDANKIKNRELLRNIMLKHGYTSFETEWWHYSWPNPKQYPILDIPFNQLKK